MKTYTVYHVKGIKVGCTDDFIRRDKANRLRYGEDIEVSKLLISDDIELVSEFEALMNKEFGYKTTDTRKYSETITISNTASHYKGKEHWNYGKKLSQATKDKISKSTKGIKKISDKQKIKLSKVTKGRLWVNNGETNKRVFPIDLDEYITLGYKQGRLKKSSTTIP